MRFNGVPRLFPLKYAWAFSSLFHAHLFPIREETLRRQEGEAGAEDVGWWVCQVLTPGSRRGGEVLVSPGTMPAVPRSERNRV